MDLFKYKKSKHSKLHDAIASIPVEMMDSG